MIEIRIDYMERGKLSTVELCRAMKLEASNRLIGIYESESVGTVPLKRLMNVEG